MSTVLSRDLSVAAFELRSAALTLVAVVLRTTDLQALSRAFAERADAAPGLFDDEPVVVDLSLVREDDEALDAEGLVALLHRHRMRPVAARGGNAAQMAAALAAGLLDAPAGARVLREAPPPPAVIERVVEVQLAPLPPLVVDKPLRSGQQIYARDRDLIVLALVSFGAEVMADGHIHVYAPLRGRAHAGKSGDTAARILCHSMQAQVLAIADVYRTTEEPLPADVAGRAAMVRLDGDHLVVEPLG